MFIVLFKAIAVLTRISMRQNLIYIVSIEAPSLVIKNNKGIAYVLSNASYRTIILFYVHFL